VVVEQHAAMRFAWLRETSGNDAPVQESLTNRIITITYNVVWWLPLVLVLTKAIDYRAGSTAFFAITILRAIANAYRNNVLKGEQAERFPFRAP
jgi:hypothetical protein